MTLTLLSNLLDDESKIDDYLPLNIKNIVKNLDGLIAEDEKEARKYLLKFLSREDFEKIEIFILNEHSQNDHFKILIEAIKNKNFGLISDSGLPCIADPGSKLVYLARKNAIEIKATVGPSSIFLALMLSGFDSQKFAFNSYLPRKEDELVSKIKELEKISKKEKMIQIFIEAPYRSDKLLDILKKVLSDTTLLSISISLTSKNERTFTATVREFKKMKIEILKNPAVFLFLA